MNQRWIFLNVIELQIMNNPLSLEPRLMRFRWNTNLYIFYLYFRWWLSFRRSTPAAHNLLLRWEATRFFLKCMPLHTSYLYISWNRRIWEATSFWRYAYLPSPQLSRSEVIIERHFVVWIFYFPITDVRSDISAIREQNPRLRVVVSLGGEAVKGSLFSSLITDNESFTNLTSSINEFHKDDVIDGLEIDWEWPVRDGGKKDRMKLIRYARVST